MNRLFTMSNRKTVLINAYVISPYKGSEASVAWNHVRNLSQEYNLIVLYGASANYMGDNFDIPHWLQSNDLPNVRFEFIKPSIISRFLTWLNKNGLTYAHYPAFRLWQKKVFTRAKEIIKSENIDLIHHLGPIGYREPGYLWKLQKPYIWGPTGGFNCAPKALLSQLPLKGRLNQLFRSFTNILNMRYSRRVKRAMQNADIVIGATSECADIIKNIYGVRAYFLPENCIDQSVKLNHNKFKQDKFHLIFVGRLDANKAVQIQLDALSILKSREDWIFDIVGEGPLRPRLEEHAKKLQISDKVVFHGLLKRSEVVDLFDKSHLHLITSLSEGNPTTVWEAMSHGVPTITLDHCGMHDTISERNGIKIPITSIDEIVRSIAFEIESLLDNSLKLRSLSKTCVEETKKYSLEQRKKTMVNYYEMAINNHYKSQQE